MIDSPTYEYLLIKCQFGYVFICNVRDIHPNWRLNPHFEILKLYVSFAKEPYKRDDILQERPIILLNRYKLYVESHLATQLTIPIPNSL